MAMRLLVAVLVIASFSVHFDTTDAVTVKYYCLPPQTPLIGGFRFVVRLRKDGDNTITGTTAVDASVTASGGQTPTESTCAATTEESSGIFLLSQDVDVGAPLPCGIEKGGGNQFKFQILAKGTSQYFTFTCDTDKLLPSFISVSNFKTKGVTNKLHHRENPYGVMFQVFAADGSYAPVSSVPLGQDIILRLIYKTWNLENDRDNWGMVFHTGFIEHDSATVMKLQIVTAGLGTNVHITGKLSGETIDKWVTVKRDAWVELEIPYANYHTTTADKKNWLKEARGLKIESSDDRIGVIAKGDGNANTDQFVVFPDDILQTNYRLFQGADKVDDDQEVVVIATKDSSDVTITYNSYKKGGLKVDGKNVGGGDTTVTLNEYDVLHIICDKSCALLEITGTKNIAVVSGWKDQGHNENTGSKGTSSAQIIPTNYYGKKYVFADSLFGKTGYHIQTDDPDVTSLIITSAIHNVDPIGSPHYLDGAGLSSSEAEFSTPVSVYMYSTGSGSTTPALVQYPSVSQWSIYNSFHMQEGITYSITIVTTKDDAAGIRYSLSGTTTTLGASATFAANLQDVQLLLNAGGGTANYEVYNDVNSFTSGGKQKILIEFFASEPWKPFMLLVYEAKGDAQSLHLPMGVRYPQLNPCTSSIPMMSPGDGKDNDCDGKVDEEISNGVDDDGNNGIDEDLALNKETPEFRGIYVKDLFVDDNAAFSSPTQVQAAGCNIISPSTKLLNSIQPFTKNTALSDDYLWVIDTPALDAFRFVGKTTVYFRVTFDFCVADLALCEKSCQSNRRKRSVQDEDNFVDIMVDVHGNETDIHIVDSNDVINTMKKDAENTHASVHPCTNNPVLWLPASLLLVTLLFEVVMTIVFIQMRAKFMNDM